MRVRTLRQLAAVVDRVVRTALFVKATPTMVKAACVATDISAPGLIDHSLPLIQYRFPRLEVSILDTTDYLSRSSPANKR